MDTYIPTYIYKNNKSVFYNEFCLKAAFAQLKIMCVLMRDFQPLWIRPSNFINILGAYLSFLPQGVSAHFPHHLSFCLSGNTDLKTFLTPFFYPSSCLDRVTLNLFVKQAKEEFHHTSISN